MIDSMTPQEIREHLDRDHWSARVLAREVCRACWGLHEVIHPDLDGLDTENYTLAWAIIHHCHSLDFFELARWCRERHGLTEWADAG